MINPIVNVEMKKWAAAKASEMLRKPIDQRQITESKLRSDTLLSTGRVYSQISFQASKTSPNSSEILLNTNDGFIATQIRLSAKKLTATPTDALHQKAQEFTYPNTYVFDGTNEVTTIFGLWNARLQILQNQAVAFPLLWTGDLRFSPDSQYGSQTGINATPAYSRVLTDAKNSPNYGFFGIEPILLLGTDQTRAQLDLGAALDITETNEYNYFTITLGGFLISGN